AAPSDPAERERYVAWAADAARHTRLVSPADVLRWNTHHSYLIELEDRGAPVVPAAWLGRGDQVELAAVLAARGWSDVELLAAVGHRGAARVDGGADGLTLPSGQHHLEVLLAHDDALIRPWPASLARDGWWSVLVVAGEVSHAVRVLPADEGDGPGRGGVVAEVCDPGELDVDLRRLAAWSVEASGVDGLVLAAVELVGDAAGTPQLAALDAVAPELHLGVRPAAAERVAAALMNAAG
ncbi:MAG: hypothetical protein ACLFRD_07720, partial [Nitriliruptoraceae bacterium]